MTDDVKAAVERFHTWEFDGLDARDHATLLAHLDGEPARTAAAVAAAREEQRAEDMLSLGREEQSSWAAFRIKAAPLTATPLADELRDEREVSQSLREQLIAAEAERDEAKEALDEFNTRRDGTPATLAEGIQAMRARLIEYRLEANALEAERDALRAQLAAETNLYKASMAEASRAIEGLRAQVKAARAKTKEEEARRVELLLLTPCASEDYKEGVRQAAAKIRSERTFTTLDAMDGAKP